MSLGLAGYYFYKAIKAKKAERIAEQQQRGTVQKTKKTPTLTSAIKSALTTVKNVASKVRDRLSTRSKRQGPRDDDCQQLLTDAQVQPESQPPVSKLAKDFFGSNADQTHIQSISDDPYDIFEPDPVLLRAVQPTSTETTLKCEALQLQSTSLNSCSTLMRAGRFHEYTSSISASRDTPIRQIAPSTRPEPSAPRNHTSRPKRPKVRREKRFEASMRAEGPTIEGYQRLPSTSKAPRIGLDLDAVSRKEFREWLLSGGEGEDGEVVVPLLGDAV